MGLPKAAGRDILTQEEVRKIIGSCSRPRDKALFSLLYITGARISELCRSYKRTGNTYAHIALSRHVEGKEGRVKPIYFHGLKRKDITFTQEDMIITLPLRKKRKSMVKQEHSLVISRKTVFMEHVEAYVKSLTAEQYLFDITTGRALQILHESSQAWLHLFRHTRLSNLALKARTPEELRQWSGHADYRSLVTYIQLIPSRTFKDEIE